MDTFYKELCDPKEKYSCQNPCDGVGIPYKLFMQMQDKQASAVSGGKEEDAELVRFQDEIGWPWKASKAQINEWDAWAKHSKIFG